MKHYLHKNNDKAFESINPNQVYPSLVVPMDDEIGTKESSPPTDSHPSKKNKETSLDNNISDKSLNSVHSITIPDNSILKIHGSPQLSRHQTSQKNYT